MEGIDIYIFIKLFDNHFFLQTYALNANSTRNNRK